MTTMTSTTRIPGHHRDAADDGRQRSSRRRRPGARAFALGATIALVCAAIAWAAVAALHHDGTPTSTAGPAAAAHPSMTSQSAGSATGGSGGGSAAGSGTAPAAGTGTGPSYPSGQDVLALQRDLGQLNYYESPIDGVSGPATVAAIKDFQRANGLPADGIAGPATMAKIQQQMATGDNQMGPSGPPVKPADTTPSKPADTTPAKPANTTPAEPANGTAGHGSQANGQTGTASGGAAAGTGTGAGA
jgi:peptidoglycan hydrolase-like protein with peptidoglycan-binding domain